jgi:hypothetical protein
MKRCISMFAVLFILTPVLGLTVLVTTHLGLTASDEFHWQGQIATGKVLEIKGVNGNVRAEAGSNGQAEVAAIKRGRRSDPKSVEIRVVEHSNGVTICAVYPDDSGHQNECLPGEGGRMNTRNNDVSVDFTVHLPAGVRFIGRTVNGQVETSALRGEVEAHTVNGNVHLSTSSYAQASTVNGSITASLGSSDWTHPVRFETVNGSVMLELPTETSAQLEAETVNGNISTDFPLTVQGKLGPKRIAGTIGSGGRQLFIKTVNGSIDLHRGH